MNDNSSNIHKAVNLITLTEKEIKSLIKGKNRKDAVDALVDATYINGAPDNVTVIIADLVETDENSPVQKLGAAQ